jgi:hypothetical protein
MSIAFWTPFTVETTFHYIKVKFMPIQSPQFQFSATPYCTVKYIFRDGKHSSIAKFEALTNSVVQL